MSVCRHKLAAGVHTNPPAIPTLSVSNLRIGAYMYCG